MSITSALIRLARAVVNQVKSQLMQQLNVVEEQVHSPLKAMVQAVTNGIWIGEGANKFVEEVSGLVIPGVGQVSGHINTLHRNVQYAEDVIDRADEQVNTAVNSLVDLFGKIY